MSNEPGPIQSLRLIREYLRLRRFMEARVVAKGAAARFPPGHDYRVLLAEIYEAEGNRARACDELRAVLREDSEHPDAEALLRRLGGHRDAR